MEFSTSIRNVIIYGINDSSHDAALSVVKNGEIVFAAHSERYNKIKNTFTISSDLLEDALQFGTPDKIAYFEKRHLKKLRRKFHGGINGEYRNLYRKIHPELRSVTEKQHSHHYSHACAGYFTSLFTNATIVVVDALGEFETTTIWEAQGQTIKKVYSQKYPVSYGLYYSAFTHLVGLKAGTEEYILMGMAPYGDPQRYFKAINGYFPSSRYQTVNFHKGVPNWPFPIATEQEKYDIAAATQIVFEKRLLEIMLKAKQLSKSRNLVYMGGCALNCTANSHLSNIFENIWIMPNPGDAGSSLGAALASHGKHVEWTGPYLGHSIPGEYPVQQLFETLVADRIVAVANGPAEFGPRALGNRSLLADPRHSNIQDLVNTVKKREKFRPFAPVVTEEDANKWFEMCSNSPYMQYTYKCRRPELLPGVTHVDGSSRVQTVNEKQHPGLYKLLKKWESHTGMPVLLNTSLNIKNQPLLNDQNDKFAWSQQHKNVKIF